MFKHISYRWLLCNLIMYFYGFFVFLLANCPAPFHASILLLSGFYGVSLSLFILHRSLERDRYCIIQVASSLSPKRRISLGALGEVKMGGFVGRLIGHGGGKVEGGWEGKGWKDQ